MPSKIIFLFLLLFPFTRSIANGTEISNLQMLYNFDSFLNDSIKMYEEYQEKNFTTLTSIGGGCPSKMTLSQNPTDNEINTAADTLISSVVIDSPLTTTYKAGKSINLIPGFEVKSGATFSALIEECTLPKYQILYDEQNIIAAVDSHILTLNSTQIEDSLQVGVCIVSPPQENLPQGFLGKIESITKINGQLIITTSEAVITDFLEEGAASGTIELTEADIVSSSFKNTGQPRKGFGINRSLDVKFPIGEDTVCVNGKVNTNLSLVYKLAFKRFRVDTFELGLKANSDVSATISGSATKVEQELFKKNYEFGTTLLHGSEKRKE